MLELRWYLRLFNSFGHRRHYFQPGPSFGNSGIGFETDCYLANRGATLIISSRSAQSGYAAIKNSRSAERALDTQSLELDLGDLVLSNNLQKRSERLSVPESATSVVGVCPCLQAGGRCCHVRVPSGSGYGQVICWYTCVAALVTAFQHEIGVILGLPRDALGLASFRGQSICVWQASAIYKSGRNLQPGNMQPTVAPEASKHSERQSAQNRNEEQLWWDRVFEVAGVVGPLATFGIAHLVMERANTARDSITIGCTIVSAATLRLVLGMVMRTWQAPKRLKKRFRLISVQTLIIDGGFSS
ncbi:hypothetical protein ABBQ38_006557 [Trebouxia sp. C0009 RCD-2024]